MKTGRGLKTNLERLEVSGKEWAECGASTLDPGKKREPKGQASAGDRERDRQKDLLLMGSSVGLHCLFLVFFLDACCRSSHSVPPPGWSPLTTSVSSV